MKDNSDAFRLSFIFNNSIISAVCIITITTFVFNYERSVLAGESQNSKPSQYISMSTAAIRHSENPKNGIAVYIAWSGKAKEHPDKIKAVFEKKYKGRVPYKFFVYDTKGKQEHTTVNINIRGTPYGGKPYFLNGQLLKAINKSVIYYNSVKDAKLKQTNKN